MRVAPYTLVSDVRHAWLAVPLDELDRLRIRSIISSYSPERGGLGFLEGDCDMEIYLKRLATLNEPRPEIFHLEVHDFHSDILNRIP